VQTFIKIFQVALVVLCLHGAAVALTYPRTAN